jgi:hypothetical protein
VPPTDSRERSRVPQESIKCTLGILDFPRSVHTVWLRNVDATATETKSCTAYEGKSDDPALTAWLLEKFCSSLDASSILQASLQSPSSATPSLP